MRNMLVVGLIAGGLCANEQLVVPDAIDHPVTSSQRYKENIENLPCVHDAFMSLRPVTFNYRGASSTKKVYGLLAEEVAELFPETVVRNKAGEPEAIQYQMFDAIMIKKIQDQQRKIDELEKTIIDMREEMQAMRDMMNVGNADTGDTENFDALTARKRRYTK